MTHMETQRMIVPFINKQLKNDELEAFLTHVKTCSECMEELEVYYTLITSMKQLDEDRELSKDFNKDLIEELNRAQLSIENKKRRHKVKSLALMIVILIVTLVSSYTIGGFVVEDIIKKVEVSDFIAEDVELITSEDLLPDVKKQFPEIYMYLRQTNTKGAAKMDEYYGDLIWEDFIIQKEFGDNTYLPEWTVLYY